MPLQAQSPDAELLDVVIVGHFNAAIFHPQWFLRQDLIGADDAAQAQVKVVSSDITDLAFGGLRLLCLPDRLTVETSNIAYAERLYDLVQSILSLLIHTPIRACGINPQAHYRIENLDYWHKIGHALAPKELIWNDLFPNPGLKGVILNSVYEGDFPKEVNVTVQPSPRIKPGLMVHTNSHYRVPEEFHDAGSADMAKSYLSSQWKTACEEARRVAAQIFVKISPDE